MRRAVQLFNRLTRFLDRVAAALRGRARRSRARTELIRLDARLLNDIGRRPEDVANYTSRHGRILRGEVATNLAEIVREFAGPAAPLHPVANDADGPAQRGKAA